MPRLFPKEDADFEVSISTHSIVRTILLVLFAVVLMAAISRSVRTLSLIGVAFFLSLALNAPVHWLADRLPGKRRGSRTLATAISVVVILIALVGFIAAIVPPLATQTTDFVKGVPRLVEDTKRGDGPIGRFVVNNGLQGQVDKLSTELSAKVDNISTTAFTTATRLGGSFIAVLTVSVLTVMMLTEGPKWRELFEQLMPKRHKAHAAKLSGEMYKVIQGYVNGQVLLAAIAAILMLPMLFAMHVSYPVALMVVVFICGLIPMVGHTIGAIIVTTVALFTSLGAALVILAYYILYQQIENYVVQPKLQANTTNMSPLLVFLSVIIGVNFGGLLGGLVAIPVAGCLRILVLDYLERRDMITEKQPTKAT